MTLWAKQKTPGDERVRPRGPGARQMDPLLLTHCFLDVRGAGDTQLTMITLLKQQEGDCVVTEALGWSRAGAQAASPRPGPQATPLSARERLRLMRDVRIWRAGDIFLASARSNSNFYAN